MTWNHRVFELEHNGEVYFELREVYYNAQGEICGHTQESAAPLGEDLVALRQDIGRMLGALDKPVLKISEINFASFDDDGEDA